MALYIPFAATRDRLFIEKHGLSAGIPIVSGKKEDESDSIACVLHMWKNLYRACTFEIARKPFFRFSWINLSLDVQYSLESQQVSADAMTGILENDLVR